MTKLSARMLTLIRNEERRVGRALTLDEKMAFVSAQLDIREQSLAVKERAFRARQASVLGSPSVAEFGDTTRANQTAEKIRRVQDAAHKRGEFISTADAASTVEYCDDVDGHDARSYTPLVLEFQDIARAQGHFSGTAELIDLIRTARKTGQEASAARTRLLGVAGVRVSAARVQEFELPGSGLRVWGA